MKKDVKTTIKQFIQFNIVGISNTLVDFGVYFLLTSLLNVNYIIAQVISYTAGIANSYIWNTLWTFKKEKRRTPKEIFLFLLVNIVSLGVSLGVLQLTKVTFGIQSELICKCCASFCSAMVNFAGNKLFVFNKVNPDYVEKGGKETEDKPENK